MSMKTTTITKASLRLLESYPGAATHPATRHHGSVLSARPSPPRLKAEVRFLGDLHPGTSPRAGSATGLHADAELVAPLSRSRRTADASSWRSAKARSQGHRTLDRRHFTVRPKHVRALRFLPDRDRRALHRTNACINGRDSRWR
jgi:hypothetical protein